MERVGARYASHEEARQASWEYYRRLTPQQRLDILLELIGMSRKEADASSERLERVYRITALDPGKKATGRTQDWADLEALGPD